MRTPRAWSFSSDAGPMPQIRSIGNGRRKPSSASGATIRTPSGFAVRLATFARNFVRAPPTVIGSPTSARTSWRSRRAIANGDP